MDRFCELLSAAQACVVQRLALEDAEPGLDLVEPACAGGREVEGDVRMSGKPVVVLLVGVQVVQDDVNLSFGGLDRKSVV